MKRRLTARGFSNCANIALPPKPAPLQHKGEQQRVRSFISSNGLRTTHRRLCGSRCNKQARVAEMAHIFCAEAWYADRHLARIAPNTQEVSPPGGTPPRDPKKTPNHADRCCTFGAAPFLRAGARGSDCTWRAGVGGTMCAAQEGVMFKAHPDMQPHAHPTRELRTSKRM